MSQANYDAMSDDELKQYFLKHRQNKEAFYAYMDRLNNRPNRVTIPANDPDFEQKFQAAVLKQMAVADRTNET